jgi:hypothetical protein
MCALLRPEKNHVQMVDAIAALRARGVPARALLIGEGPTRAAVEARAAQRGVARHVLITGMQEMCGRSSPPATPSRCAARAWRPSRWPRSRPWPWRVRWCTPSLGGAAEMITHGSDGYLFPVGDTPALVERLAELALPARASAWAQAARASVASRFAEQAMVERYEQLFLELETTRSIREDFTKTSRRGLAPAGAAGWSPGPPASSARISSKTCSGSTRRWSAWTTSPRKAENLELVRQAVGRGALEELASSSRATSARSTPATRLAPRSIWCCTRRASAACRARSTSRYARTTATLTASSTC